MQATYQLKVLAGGFYSSLKLTISTFFYFCWSLKKENLIKNTADNAATP